MLLVTKIRLSILGGVSILIQPEGWMLWTVTINSVHITVFQSSSSPKAGCY